MLSEHIDQQGIVRVRDLCEALFTFNVQCDLIYDSARDFAGVVDFSRNAVFDVLDTEPDVPLQERIRAMQRLAFDIELELRKAPGVEID